MKQESGGRRKDAGEGVKTVGGRESWGKEDKARGGKEAKEGERAKHQAATELSVTYAEAGWEERDRVVEDGGARERAGARSRCRDSESKRQYMLSHVFLNENLK
mgnify:CR=1 FL=1